MCCRRCRAPDSSSAAKGSSEAMADTQRACSCGGATGITEGGCTNKTSKTSKKKGGEILKIHHQILSSTIFNTLQPQTGPIIWTSSEISGPGGQDDAQHGEQNKSCWPLKHFWESKGGLQMHLQNTRSLKCQQVIKSPPTIRQLFT